MAAEQYENHPILGVLMISISIIGLAGNIITLILIKKYATFRDTNNGRLFLGNLAVADLLNSVLAFFSGLGYISKDIMGGNLILCYTTAYSRRFFPYVAVFGIALVTINRYCTTIHSNKAGRLFQTKLSWVYIVSCWLVLFVLFMAALIINADATPNFENDWGLCYINFKPMSLVSISLSLLCLLSLFCFNLRICFYVRHHNKTTGAYAI